MVGCDGPAGPWSGWSSLRLLAVSRDITTQREVEEEVRRLNATLEERIFYIARGRNSQKQGTLSPDDRAVSRTIGLFLLSAEGTVTTYGIAELNGLRVTLAEEIVGQHFSCFYAVEDVREIYRAGGLLSDAIGRKRGAATKERRSARTSSRFGRRSRSR